VEVEMRDQIAGVCTHIEHEPVAPLIGWIDALANKSLDSGDVLGEKHKIDQFLGVFGREVIGCANMPPGDDEDMSGRLRVDIAECDAPFARRHLVGRYLADDDAAEEAVAHGSTVAVGA
jgi:hypothetical protein